MLTQSIMEVSLYQASVLSVILLFSIFLPMIYLARSAPNLLISTTAYNTKWLDGLRGIAAAMVGINHAPLTLGNLYLNSQTFFISFSNVVLFRGIGSLGVQFFFCITGMLFTWQLFYSDKPIDWTLFYRKRLRRIVPAYLVACIFALIIIFCCNGALKQPIKQFLTTLPELFSFGFRFPPVLNDFDSMRLLGVNWTLSKEWSFYLLLPIIFVFSRTSRTYTTIALLALAIADVFLTRKSIWVFFMSGAMCAPLMHYQFNKVIKLLACISFWIALAVLLKNGSHYPDYGPTRWILTTVLFASMAVIRPRLLMVKEIIAMGTISYSFYLLHAMTIFSVASLCHYYLFDITTLDFNHYTLMLAAALILATCIATLSYKYIESPWLRQSKALSEKTPNLDITDNSKLALI